MKESLSHFLLIRLFCGLYWLNLPLSDVAWCSCWPKDGLRRLREILCQAAAGSSTHTHTPCQETSWDLFRNTCLLFCKCGLSFLFPGSDTCGMTNPLSPPPRRIPWKCAWIEKPCILAWTSKEWLSWLIVVVTHAGWLNDVRVNSHPSRCNADCMLGCSRMHALKHAKERAGLTQRSQAWKKENVCVHGTTRWPARIGYCVTAESTGSKTALNTMPSAQWAKLFFCVPGLLHKYTHKHTHAHVVRRHFIMWDKNKNTKNLLLDQPWDTLSACSVQQKWVHPVSLKMSNDSKLPYSNCMSWTAGYLLLYKNKN